VLQEQSFNLNKMKMDSWLEKQIEQSINHIEKGVISLLAASAKTALAAIFAKCKQHNWLKEYCFLSLIKNL
jgi:hypothetical protein